MFAFIIIVPLTLIGLSFATMTVQEQSPKYSRAEINKQIFHLEIADEAGEWYSGLSFREKLCDRCGMIFIFPDERERSFVMRNMNFPLDMIWIRDNTIIGSAENLNPETEPYSQHRSNQAADAVLELAAGSVKNFLLETGTQIKYVQ